MVSTKKLSLDVNEIFYSLQGEGARAGEASLFVRLQRCSAKHACFESGVVCDTEFESGYTTELGEILKIASANKARWIIWTGGEPADQVTDEVVKYVSEAGYKQAIECSGIKQPPQMDWIVLSPKIAEHAILKKWKKRDGFHCDELRWVRMVGQEIPITEITARTYYISPHFDGYNLNRDNVNECAKLCLENPQWRLSVQQHKLWNVR